VKPPRPSTLEKIQAKRDAAAKPTVQINFDDVRNVIVAARRALGGFSGADLVTIAGSIANLEAILASLQVKPATPPPTPPADQPAEKSKA
jgi:hypothetical protein